MLHCGCNRIAVTTMLLHCNSRRSRYQCKVFFFIILLSCELLSEFTSVVDAIYSWFLLKLTNPVASLSWCGPFLQPAVWHRYFIQDEKPPQRSHARGLDKHSISLLAVMGRNVKLTDRCWPVLLTKKLKQLDFSGAQDLCLFFCSSS